MGRIMVLLGSRLFNYIFNVIIYATVFHVVGMFVKKAFEEKPAIAEEENEPEVIFDA